MSSDEQQPLARSVLHLNQAESVKPLIEYQSIPAPGGGPIWDHSAHIIDFVKAVLKDRGSRDVGPEASEVLSSLRKLVQALEDPAAARGLSFPKAKLTKHQANPPMPPLEAVLMVLRWAKGSLLPITACLKLPNIAIRSRGVYKNRLDFTDTSSSKLHRDLPKGILRSR